jgi:hypothetical protein
LTNFVFDYPGKFTVLLYKGFSNAFRADKPGVKLQESRGKEGQKTGEIKTDSKKDPAES